MDRRFDSLIAEIGAIQEELDTTHPGVGNLADPPEYYEWSDVYGELQDEAFDNALLEHEVADRLRVYRGRLREVLARLREARDVGPFAERFLVEEGK